ncbi:MAG: hypothetical protein K8J08_13245 [Thermoanaerobaculia bacterium]|nr:hypothetical protein [Thermoanaerobaculia bacterium]
MFRATPRLWTSLHPRHLLAACESDRPADLSRRVRWISLLVCALGIASREPMLLIEPRMVAEEATVYLAYAFSNGFLRSLLLIPASEGPAGYLHLLANLSALLSTHVLPLEWAPRIGTCLAFLAQLLPFAVVLWGRSRLWNSPSRRYLLCLVFLLAPAVRSTVWLQVIHAQIFLGLVAFLLLFENLDGASRRRLWTYRGLLLLGSLTGAYTVLLAPIFGMRYYLTRQREAFHQFVIVATVAVLQASALATYWWTLGRATQRLQAIWHPRVPLTALVEHLVQPLFGNSATTALNSPATGLTPLLVVVILALLAILGWLAWKCGGGIFWLMPIGLSLLIASTSILSYGAPAGRYAVFSGMVLLTSLLVASWNRRVPAPARGICAGLVLVALFCGASSYWKEGLVPFVGQQDVAFSRYLDYRPVWRREVAAWRIDHDHVLRIWPYNATNSWKTHLTPASDFETLRRTLARADDFHLFSDSQDSRSLELSFDRLPPDFRLIVDGEVTPPDAATRIHLRFLDVTKEPLTELEFEPSEDGTLTINLLREDLKMDALATAKVTAMTVDASTDFLASALDGGASVVAVHRIDIAPRVEGLLDGLLPIRDLPDRWYSSSRRGPVAQEAGLLSALDSVALDGDARLATADRQRISERWLDGAPEVGDLRNGPEGGFQVSRVLLLLLSPFYSAQGVAAIVVLNGLLLGVMAVLLSGGSPSGPRQVLYVVGSLILSLTAGFAFLPQSTVLEAFCLFVPTWAWIGRRWTRAAWPETILYGACMGVAILINPFWSVVFLAAALDRSLRTSRRFLMGTVGSAATVIALTTVAGQLAVFRGSNAFGPLVTGSASFDGGWNLASAPLGWFLGYPFAAVTIAWLIRGEADNRRIGLAGLLVALCTWFAVSGGSNALEGPLGDPRTAVVMPLFAIVPSRIPGWWFTTVALLIGILVTWGTVSSIWTP